jgi:hypothetical protein
VRLVRRRRKTIDDRKDRLVAAVPGVCVNCGSALAPVLVPLGVLLCHDCRDDPAVNDNGSPRRSVFIG